MTSRELERIGKRYFLPFLPGFAIRGRLLFVQPIEFVLRGFMLEPSYNDPSRFRIEVFVQPLYVPDDGITFGFGTDLGRLITPTRLQTWWWVDENIETTMATIRGYLRSAGLAWLEPIITPLDVATKAKFSNDSDELHYFRAVGYSYVLVGQPMKGISAIEKLIAGARGFEERCPWIPPLVEEATRMRDLAAQEPGQAIEKLMDYRDYTLKALKLDRWAVPRTELQL